MKRQRTALIVGGGVGGIVAAKRLRRLLPREHRVVLVEREEQHVFQPSLLWLAVGRRKPEQIQRPLARLGRYGFEVVRGEITALDPERRQVRIGADTLEGDAVVISLGAELAPERVSGLGVAGHNLYTLPGTLALRDALRNFRSGRVVVLTAAPAYKCPAAPYEAAMLVADSLTRQAAGGGWSVDLFAAEAAPMATAGPEVAAAVRALVEARGIHYHPEHQVVQVEPESRTLRFSNGVSAEYELLIYVPPHAAPEVVRAAGLTGESGWVSVDARTLATPVPGVYAIGDVTSIPLPSGRPLPKAGVFARRQAEVVAENIAADWAGRPPERTFDGKGACFIEAGAGRAGYGSGDFYATPAPVMRLYAPSRWWYFGKVLVEKRWLRQF
ncbi:MAG: NAD(P)/FAD-dependent oxidoreductase [Gemmatimonadetes bacterium]|nr:NAD(P)/FAD-dependent oxidoreductase [Gemmatimonadota bacterium]